MRHIRCGGRYLVDRTFSENKNYELSCLRCGQRKFISKKTRFGQWLGQKEEAFGRASVRVGD